MTLNDMSATHNSKTGEALGFTLKSNKTGNTFVAIAKAINGKFVIQSTSEKDSIFTVSGDVDRYSFSGNVAKGKVGTNKASELRGRIEVLQTRETEIESRMEEIETQQDSLSEEYETLEQELGDIGSKLDAASEEMESLDS